METLTKPSPTVDGTDRGQAGSYTATQTFETPGIKPMGRPSFTTRAVMRIVAWIERLNLRSAKLGNPPVYDLNTFPWAREIEREWHLIRAELDRVLVRRRICRTSTISRPMSRPSAPMPAGRRSS